ncbi:MAG: hypothetical protein QM589_01190 [Thermomicrobiales bacterium]
MQTPGRDGYTNPSPSPLAASGRVGRMWLGSDQAMESPLVHDSLGRRNVASGKRPGQNRRVVVSATLTGGIVVMRCPILATIGDMTRSVRKA